MQVTKREFAPCLAAIRAAGYEVDYRGSTADGIVCLCLRMHIDATAAAEAAGRCGVRRARGYNWTAAKTAWEEHVRKCASRAKRNIKRLCARRGFPSVRIHLVNMAGGALENAARGMARFAGGAMIDNDGNTAIIRKGR